jgi:hypothetical protein
VPSKTKESGRADILVRMAPLLKTRIVAAAKEDEITVNDWLLDVIERALAVRDAEVASGKRKADFDRRLEVKFEEIVVVLAAEGKLGDRSKLASEKQIELEEKAQSAIEDWTKRTAVDHYARPRTPLEQLCSDYLDIETEIAEGIPEDRSDYFQIQLDDVDPDDDELDDADADGE